MKCYFRYIYNLEQFFPIYIFGFRVHHYNSGTWEEFLTPEDARQTLFISAMLMLAMA